MNFEYKVEGSKGSGQTGACNLIINAVLCYFFYTYWQNNPDQGECWATATSTTPSATQQAGYEDVSAQFVTWFKWGFIINVVAIVLAVVQFIHAATDNALFQTVAAILGCPLGCGGLAWFIAGLVLRYRQIGNICSGDYYRENLELNPTAGQVGDLPYQWKSGNFINYYYITIACILGLVCCCACTVAIVGGAVAASQ